MIGTDPRTGAGVALDLLGLEILAIPIEMLIRRPKLDQIEPFLRIGIAGFVIIGQRQAKRLIFRLVPARDNVQPGTPMADLASMVAICLAITAGWFAAV